MELFIRFIQWASIQPDAILPNAKSPFVSSGDVQSRHAALYAHFKPYAEHHSAYPVVTYSADGKPSRKYTGALMMVVCDLVDILPDRNHHIPSLDADGRIRVDVRVVPERESTFFAQVPGGRVKYIEMASYPSFDGEHYLRNFHHQYGITQDQYKLIRIIFSQNDQRKRDVLKHYLDAYLTAYRALFLMRRAVTEYPDRPYARRDGAHEQFISTDEHRVRILYRDRHGTFSFHPVPSEFGERADESSFIRRSFAKMRSLDAGGLVVGDEKAGDVGHAGPAVAESRLEEEDEAESMSLSPVVRPRDEDVSDDEPSQRHKRARLLDNDADEQTHEMAPAATRLVADKLLRQGIFRYQSPTVNIVPMDVVETDADAHM